MARLQTDPADDSDSVNIPSRRRPRLLKNTAPTNTKAPTRKMPTTTTRSTDTDTDTENPDVPMRLIPKTNATAKGKRTQIRLAPTQGTNNFVNPAAKATLRDINITHTNVDKAEHSRNASQQSHFDSMRPVLGNKKLAGRQEKTRAVQIDVEESIWCDSIDGSEASSEGESPDLRKVLPRKGQCAVKTLPLVLQPDLTERLKALSIFDNDIDSAIVKPEKTTSKRLQSNSRPPSSSDKENDAIIRYSPSRLKSPHKQNLLDRPQTPPLLLPPEKFKLKSPSKTAARVPTPPLRPSLDAFWTADAVNEWNDQYSPQKQLKSPRKLFFRPESEDASPTASPRKPQSPAKRTKVELDARKDFEARKITMAECFLQELDQKITNGQVQQLAQSTGGVKLVWSKTLNSTAGRANWRHETTKTKHSDCATTLLHKHFASIELATKVIDCEHRLLNVMAHEFCHLANFMVSGVKDQPHGKQFKEWGRLCTRAFGNRGVEVTTKHSYEIEYKYIWQCTSEECAMEFKRHSKSIDPSRQRCGGCKSGLVQIKPVPRRGAKLVDSKSRTPTPGDMGGSAKANPVTGYAAYVKQHFAPLKKSMPGASHQKVMEALGKKYRADKAAGMLGKPDFSSLADDVAKDLDRIKLGGNDDPVVIDSD